jgi:hypothetical protein
MHAPLLHVCEALHADAPPHVPHAPHVSTPLPEHRVCPGAHEPWHDAPTAGLGGQHVWLVHDEVAPQAPAAEQTWVPLPDGAQRTLDGAQLP